MGLKEAVQFFPCSPPPPGKAGPTLPRALCVFPSEELGLLSLVHVRHHLPTPVCGLSTPVSLRGPQVFLQLFSSICQPPRTWTDSNTLSPCAIYPATPLPAFHHPGMNGFCNSSFCILWTCYFLLFFCEAHTLDVGGKGVICCS